MLIAIFQSWAQLVDAYGTQGAEKLWSAANVRVYGGGVSDTTFLRRLSDLCGEHEQTAYSSSRGYRQGVTRSQSIKKESTLNVSTLGALPPKRALVLLSAATPVIVKLTPWWKQTPTIPKVVNKFLHPQIEES